MRVKVRVCLALERSIEAAGLDCEALGDGLTVAIDDDTDYEPDALVNCGPPMEPDETVATNPVVVVEVLSPGSMTVDTGEKLAGYFKVPSIRHYLIVNSRRREVVHHRRDGDGIATRVVNVGTILLEPPGLSLDIVGFYARG